MADVSSEQRFGPTSGVVTGWAGVVLAVLVAIGLVVEDPSVTGVGTAALILAFGVVAWSFMLRPRVLLRGSELVLRNAFTDWEIPLRAVDDIVVRQTTVVAVDDELYRGIGVGRPLRQVLKQPRPVGDASGDGGTTTRTATRLGTSEIPDFMIGQVLARRDSTLEAVRRGGGEQADAGAEVAPRREYAVPELVLIGVFGALFVLLVVLL